MLWTSTILTAGIALFLVVALVRSIQNERKRSNVKKIWSNFSLGIVLCFLFFASWFAQGLAEWRSYVEQQHTHEEPVTASGFVTEFSQSTLENWQSEFLQLFSFVVLAALYLHRGSAESKDSDERIESKVDEIKQMLQDRRSS